MNYALSNQEKNERKQKTTSSVRRLIPLMVGERSRTILAIFAMAISAGSALLAPVLISRAIDTAIGGKDYRLLFIFLFILLGVYLVSVASDYIQTRTMGAIGRRVLFRLRNDLFTKLQSLPIAFFHQNKTGDLISRINSDTDRLNQFFAQVLMQFLKAVFLIAGTAILILFLHPRLGTIALIPAVGVLLVTRAISPWVKRKNRASLESLGDMSAEIQESLDSFKVIVAFNRLDYFREKFGRVNQLNYQACVRAGYANNILRPLYELVGNIAQLLVLVYAIFLIGAGQVTIGLLVGFLIYVNQFYTPLRQIASVWSSFQQALAALDRISEILAMESNIPVIDSPDIASNALVEFRDVSFGYVDTDGVLKHISFELEKGKTYALVGPTGGGKTTIASLVARLYDPSSGIVVFYGKDIRSLTLEERTRRIGFVLQEPFLFSGTVLENIFYGNTDCVRLSSQERIDLLKREGLFDLLSSFSHGLDVEVGAGGEGMSLGQRQLIVFMRAVLRKPDLFILDEATANVDTVTEQLLEEVLRKLPVSTTKIVIAHRLNTIENADGIFFVNAGTVTPAGSFDHAVEMLLHGQRKS